MKSGPPAIDYQKFVQYGEFNTLKTAQNTWGKIKQKLAQAAGPKTESDAGGDEGDGDGESPTLLLLSTVELVADDAEAAPKTPKKPTTPKKRTKKAADEEGGEEDASPKKKRSPVKKAAPKKAKEEAEAAEEDVKMEKEDDE